METACPNVTGGGGDVDRPTAGDVLEAQSFAEQVLEDIETYREVAGAIDSNFEMQNEHRNLSLDDMPYGEELIRTRDLPAKVEDALKVFSKIEEGAMLQDERPEAFASALNAVESARSELGDCKSLPGELEDSDD